VYKLARMHKTLHTQLGSSGLSHNFEHSQVSLGALSTNSGMQDKTKQRTNCLILRHIVHKIDAKQGKKIAGHLWPPQARKSMPCGWTFVKTIYCQIYVWQYNWTYVLFRVLGLRASDVVPRQLYLVQCNHICHIYVLPCCRLYVQYQVAPT